MSSNHNHQLTLPMKGGYSNSSTADDDNDYDDDDDEDDDDDFDEDSPIWIRQKFFIDSCANDRFGSISDLDRHERDPSAMDTLVVSNFSKVQVIKSTLGYNDNGNNSNNNNTGNSYTRLTRPSCTSILNFRNRLLGIRDRINLRTIASGARSSFRCLHYQISRRWRAKASREPKEKIGRGRTENRARKALKTITFILGAFVICWTPYHIFVLIDVYSPKFLNRHLFNLSYWLCYANSPINPFCYALANIQFKKTFLRMLRLDFHRT